MSSAMGVVQGPAPSVERPWPRLSGAITVVPGQVGDLVVHDLDQAHAAVQHENGRSRAKVS